MTQQARWWKRPPPPSNVAQKGSKQMSKTTTSSLDTHSDTDIKSTVHKHDAIHAVTQEHIDVLDEDDRLLDFYEWQQIIRASETTVRRLAHAEIEIEERADQSLAPVLSPATECVQLRRHSLS